MFDTYFFNLLMSDSVIINRHLVRLFLISFDLQPSSHIDAIFHFWRNKSFDNLFSNEIIDVSYINSMTDIK